MLVKKIFAALMYCSIIFFPALAGAKEITISSPKITMVLDYGDRARITSLVVNEQKVVSGADGIFTSVNTGGVTYSSLHLKGTPVLLKQGNVFKLTGINYGDVKENWVFTITGKGINWTIERTSSKPIKADELATPVF